MSELADTGDSGSIGRGTGDPDKEPALKGWNEMDGRRPVTSTGRDE